MTEWSKVLILKISLLTAAWVQIPPYPYLQIGYCTDNMFRYYVLDLGIYILLVLICFSLIFYNMDIILYSLLLSNINNYFISMIDNYDYGLVFDESVKYSDILNQSKLDNYYSISNINISAAFNTDIKFASMIISIIITLPYVLYLAVLYLMPFSNILFRSYIYVILPILIILYYTYIFIYTAYIYPVILNYDWDYIFDSDISNYMPYGIELIYTLNTDILLNTYVIGYITYLIITYLYILFSIYKYKIAKLIIIILCLLLFDYKFIYVLCIGEFIYIIYLTVYSYK